MSKTVISSAAFSPGSTCVLAGRVFLCVPLLWSLIEPPSKRSASSAESYDEAFLADLRLKLKAAEDEVLLQPMKDRAGDDGAFTAAVVHGARRLKDCEKVAGMKLGFPPPLAEALKNALKLKHPHYIYAESRL